jgi:hypothetical protein
MTIEQLIKKLEKEKNQKAKIRIKFWDWTFNHRVDVKHCYFNVDRFYIITND